MSNATKVVFDWDKALEFQSSLCRHYESELYAKLLDHCRGNAAAQAIAEGPWDYLRDFVPLRLLGGVHQLVLSGAAPALAEHYPTTGGAPRWPGAWDAFRSVLIQHRDFLRDFLSTTPQTNEVARSAALSAGFHQVAREFAQPLRLRELGASAGLNLLWDHYRFDLGGLRFGPDSGGPLLQPEWTGNTPPLSHSLSVSSRAGCDVAPIRLSEAEPRARLQAYVWADQPERLERLRSAIEIALKDPPRLDQARAGEWIAAELRELPENSATVVYHSSFWVYLPPEEQASIRRDLEAAAARATPTSALAYLQVEDFDGHFELRLRMWPGGEEKRLAATDPHGRAIRWFGDGEAA